MKPVTLRDVVLTLAFFGIAILALQFWILKPAKERARARSCYSTLVQIVLASRMYGYEHRTGYQTNLICLSNELFSPRHLVCVDDEVRYGRMRAKADRGGYGSGDLWARLTMDDCSYHVSLRGSNAVVVGCPFHRIACYTDAQMTNEGSWIKRENFVTGRSNGSASK